MRSSVSAYTIGRLPSAAPTMKTTGHSRPFAECRVVTVTPSAVGACDSCARRSNSSTSSDIVLRPEAATSSASARTAASDSQRSRVAPPLAGPVDNHPIPARTAWVCSTRPFVTSPFAARRVIGASPPTSSSA